MLEPKPCSAFQDDDPLVLVLVVPVSLWRSVTVRNDASMRTWRFSARISTSSPGVAAVRSPKTLIMPVEFASVFLRSRRVKCVQSACQLDVAMRRERQFKRTVGNSPSQNDVTNRSTTASPPGLRDWTAARGQLAIRRPAGAIEYINRRSGRLAGVDLLLGTALCLGHTARTNFALDAASNLRRLRGTPARGLPIDSS